MMVGYALAVEKSMGIGQVGAGAEKSDLLMVKRERLC